MTKRTFDLYWSFRSPYCYLAMDRLFQLSDQTGVDINMRHVWPGAMRSTGYFDRLNPNYMTYHGLDSKRTAQFQGIPYARPVPDPLVFDPKTREPLADQPYIRSLTRLALAACELGAGHIYLKALMRLLWDGRVKGWNEGDHLETIAGQAGLDFTDLNRCADDNAERFDKEVDDNGKSLVEAGHWGVPCMVFEGEPFFGQDRIDILAHTITVKERHR